MTNSKQLKEIIDQNEEKYEYSYEVKAFGNFTAETLQRIRSGAIIKDKKLGPFYVS